MKSKHFIKFAAIIAAGVFAFEAKADTEILTQENGWNKITELPVSPTDYYYVFVDHGQDLMMTFDTGVNQDPAHKTMWYRTSANPNEDYSKVWTIEFNTVSTANTHVSFRSIVDPTYCLQTPFFV